MHSRSHDSVREIGTALAVLSLYVLTLLLPLHQAAGLQNDLARLGFEQSVSVTLASPALGIEPMRRDAVGTGRGWRVGDLTVPAAGTWQLELDLRVSRFELSKLQAEFSVPQSLG